MPLTAPTQEGKELYRCACVLFDALWNGNPIRLLGVRSGKLTNAGEPFQMDLFSYDPVATAKRQKLDQAMEKIKKKYGSDAIHRGM